MLAFTGAVYICASVCVCVCNKGEGASGEGDSSLTIVISVRVKNCLSDSGVTSDSCVARQLNHTLSFAQYPQKDDSGDDARTHTHTRLSYSTNLVRTFH